MSKCNQEFDTPVAAAAAAAAAGRGDLSSRRCQSPPPPPPPPAARRLRGTPSDGSLRLSPGNGRIYGSFATSAADRRVQIDAVRTRCRLRQFGCADNDNNNNNNNNNNDGERIVALPASSASLPSFPSLPDDRTGAIQIDVSMSQATTPRSSLPLPKRTVVPSRPLSSSSPEAAAADADPATTYRPMPLRPSRTAFSSASLSVSNLPPMLPRPQPKRPLHSSSSRRRTIRRPCPRSCHAIKPRSLFIPIPQQQEQQQQPSTDRVTTSFSSTTGLDRTAADSHKATISRQSFACERDLNWLIHQFPTTLPDCDDPHNIDGKPSYKLRMRL